MPSLYKFHSICTSLDGFPNSETNRDLPKVGFIGVMKLTLSLGFQLPWNVPCGTNRQTFSCTHWSYHAPHKALPPKLSSHRWKSVVFSRLQLPCSVPYSISEQMLSCAHHCYTAHSEAHWVVCSELWCAVHYLFFAVLQLRIMSSPCQLTAHFYFQ